VVKFFPELILYEYITSRSDCFSIHLSIHHSVLSPSPSPGKAANTPQPAKSVFS